MIIDCNTWSNLPDRGESQRRRVFVDGVEVHGVWYVDTEAGIAKTYHVVLGGTVTSSRFKRLMVPDDWEIEAPLDGVVSRTIRGQVELKPLPKQSLTQTAILGQDNSETGVNTAQ
jgi:hypothetical protein